MSRICVKNLPKYATEDRLRDFFSQKGEVTDAKLMRTKDGKSRQFAFVGFRTEQEAEEALKFFNNAYMDTSKIVCELARKVGDPNIPRPWSRYSAKKENPSSTNNNDLVGEKTRSLTNSEVLGTVDDAEDSHRNETKDPDLQEFLRVMQPRAKSKLWEDDTLSTAFIGHDGKVSVEDTLPLRSKKKPSAEVQVQSTDESISNSTDPLDEIVQDERISDADYLKSKVGDCCSDSEIDEDEGLNSMKSQTAEADAKGQTFKTEEQINASNHHREAERELSLEGHDALEENNENLTSLVGSEDKHDFDNCRLFVRNLPYTTNEDELLELFSQFGDVSEVHLVVDKDTKRSKGMSYVLYKLPESAVRALEELDNSIFQGRLLHIMPAEPRKTSTEKLQSGFAAGQDKKNLKQRREEEKKASESRGDTRAWNSLFMRPDTVVENIARKHGISKSDLLEREADDLAVRIALGETQVIAETKKSLSSAGVNVAALEEFASKKTNNLKRSNHVVLVKNLPYGSSEGELGNMFGKFGSLDKIILPPTKAMALVIFLEASEARAAFKGLAYKRYKDAPLYLEWAPGDILNPVRSSEQGDTNNVDKGDTEKSVLLQHVVEDVPEEDLDPDRVESRSVFVKNLNFKTSDECLKKHFSDHIKGGILKSAKVKKHLKNGKNVSMGFGFIEFDSIETATAACRDLQGTVLDGHALILQLCHAKKDGQAPKKNNKDLSSTKLIVRNVAFEATEKDLRQLFSPFGQIKRLRLPMKFGSHRGFAFVEFVTKQEAQNALQALSSTHLYGRHLVLERAKEGESLEELRARTATQFFDGQGGIQKLSKKRRQTNAADEGNIKSARISD
ncbi:multiple RNA-binding domain-containing protein 1 [Iris pallida]|uniref:Multiple RNA-binding domain-containing protein 1 n=1 Tax=Iris pallida TaxID=29817 RepID=A0AAX6HR06_IRIPA|nr:multiple RNA-binding domain-containing protein 1 [Iris pallida]